MNKFSLYQILIFFILISIISSDKKHKKKKSKSFPKKEILEEIPALYKWAEKNNIFINDKITLNKNTDLSGYLGIFHN